ncbi:hypothetical protein F5Y19DRAFT_468255 [Xylariaceae sp. FL1651]|nr:hypothetical protein F5Y19DRAFT_468255 [Xylariaceae sp. FL1651]
MPPHYPHKDHPLVSTKGKGPEAATWWTPSNLYPALTKTSTHRLPLSQSTFALPRAAQETPQPLSDLPLPEGDPRNEDHSSNTWTSSSGNPDRPSEEDEADDRERFVQEYNRLAQRHRVRLLVPGDFSSTAGRCNDSLASRQGSWFSKMIRQTSEQSAPATTKSGRSSLRHQRSLSDAALNFVHNHKRDGLKDLDLKALVRLCGKSTLFLPTDYAPCSLVLPTCFRALAQALVQHADTKGIFRVSGSVRVINALYDYYCTESNTSGISSTTRCPTLPTHIRCNAHDVASTFKRFLAGLPGGILGSLSLFDALVAIHSQLQGDPELHQTKETKLRARLIALAIGTVKSHYQRELICAVFGLLCLVGRTAENAPREDDSGRPLPTADLMGYNALGIVFGPLLITDLIDSYSTKVADPSAGLVLLPLLPPKSRKERHRHKHKHRHTKQHATRNVSSFSVDKIHIANSITEMLIVHWREVVRQMRSIGSVKIRRDVPNMQFRANAPNTRSKVSNMFPFRNPPEGHHTHRESNSPSTASAIQSPSKVSVYLSPWLTINKIIRENVNNR